MINTNTSYGYLTTFAYYQEFDANKIANSVLDEITGLTLQCGYYSYAEAPKKYKKIMGVTGTLE